MEHQKLSLNIYISRHRLTGTRGCYDRHFLIKVNNSCSAFLTACDLGQALLLFQAHKPKCTWHSSWSAPSREMGTLPSSLDKCGNSVSEVFGGLACPATNSTAWACPEHTQINLNLLSFQRVNPTLRSYFLFQDRSRSIYPLLLTNLFSLFF